MNAQAVIAADPFIVVDGVVVSDPGHIPGIRSSAHHEGRPCVHLHSASPPRVVLLGWDAVSLLNFQPRFVETPAPAHASRRGDELALGFDVFAGRDCTARGPLSWWTYRLHRFQWASRAEPSQGIVAALRINDVPRRVSTPTVPIAGVL